jgi:uncharacterized membrane protein YoaK (UPF0700 family)
MSSSANDAREGSLSAVLLPRGVTPSRTVLLTTGCLLAANSGFLNGLALSGVLVNKKQAVAAMTGSWTTAGVVLGQRGSQWLSCETDECWTPVCLIASYLAGAVMNGAFFPSGELEWENDIMYAPVSLIGCFCCVTLASLTRDTATPRQFGMLLAVCHGLQNSWSSMLLPGNVLRTTHYTGMTSDMGTFMGQIIGGNSTNVWKLHIFLVLCFSFVVGAALSVYALAEIGENCLLVSAVLYLALYLYVVLSGISEANTLEYERTTLKFKES